MLSLPASSKALRFVLGMYICRTACLIFTLGRWNPKRGTRNVASCLGFREYLLGTLKKERVCILYVPVLPPSLSLARSLSSLFLPLSLSFSLFLSLSLSLSLSLFLSLSLSLSLSLALSPSRPLCLSISLHVCLSSVCLPAWLSVCLSVWLCLAGWLAGCLSLSPPSLSLSLSLFPTSVCLFLVSLFMYPFASSDFVVPTISA